ncbi:hypothetical protein B0H14DRAFT_3139499 [Mycena olivaceomarginata]|nr:hypothetical protein B0H14DRAFT_3139499 [Mycena olivaceomarginata]
MDSQITLVTSTPPISLVFATDSMINTTLQLNSRAAYTISTKLEGTTTEIRASGSGELVARICRNGILPYTVAFPSSNGKKDIRLSKWLHPYKLDGVSLAHRIETELGNCVLKVHPTYRLALFLESDFETPIAHWARSEESSQLLLVLCSGTEKFVPQIIAAFTIQELKMRNQEKSDRVAQFKAAAPSQAAKAVVGVGR